MSWIIFRETLGPTLRQPLIAALAATWIAAAAVDLVRHRLVALRRDPLLLYALASTLVLLLTAPRLGASSNYFVEPSLAWLLYLVGRAASIDRTLRMPRLAPAALAALAAVFALELATAPRNQYSFTDPVETREGIKYFALVRSEIVSLGGEDARVLHLLRAQDRYGVQDPIYYSDALLYRVLLEMGTLPPDPFVDAIRRAQFDVIVADPASVEQALRTDTPNGFDLVLRAIGERYVIGGRGLVWTYFVPRR